MPVNLLLLKRAMVGLRVRLPGACRTAFSLLPSLLREGFVIRLRGCGPCFLVVICTLMWFGSRVWLLLSCGSVFAPVSCLLGRVGSGRVLLVSVVGCLRRVSRSFSRGFGGMSSRTFVSICLSGHNVDCHIGLAQHNVRQGWRAWVFQRWLGSGRHELLRLPQLSADSFRALDITNVRNWILSAAPAASVGLGLLSVLVTGLFCPMLVISLPPVCGAAGKLGFGITSAGPAPVVLPLLLVVLVVLCWLALVGLVRTPIFLRKKLTESEVGYLHAN